MSNTGSIVKSITKAKTIANAVSKPKYTLGIKSEKISAAKPVTITALADIADTTDKNQIYGTELSLAADLVAINDNAILITRHVVYGLRKDKSLEAAELFKSANGELRGQYR